MLLSILEKGRGREQRTSMWEGNPSVASHRRRTGIEPETWVVAALTGNQTCDLSLYGMRATAGATLSTVVSLPQSHYDALISSQPSAVPFQTQNKMYTIHPGTQGPLQHSSHLVFRLYFSMCICHSWKSFNFPWPCLTLLHFPSTLHSLIKSYHVLIPTQVPLLRKPYWK